MEGREGVTAGVTVIGAEAPSDYEMVARTENPTLIAGSPAVDASPVSVGFTGTVGKKKRGRPRKYQPDGMGTMTLSPMPISSSAPLSGNFSSGKRGRGRPVGSESKQKQKVGLDNSGNGGPSWPILRLKVLFVLCCEYLDCYQELIVCYD